MSGGGTPSGLTAPELDAARWFALARRDLARAEAAAQDDAEAAVFFFRQSAEKALKAALVRAGTAFGRTHSLDRLLVLAGRLDPGFLDCPGDPERVSAYVARFRYSAEDGMDGATAEDVAAARLVATWLAETAERRLAGPVADLAAQILAGRTARRWAGDGCIAVRADFRVPCGTIGGVASYGPRSHRDGYRRHSCSLTRTRRARS